ncbi:unnamed protein product [Medioppia subpectinata]|uniref:Nuclear receptor n=1 Tax=Medioppia subpectinata TaxID=1979941 RepID=A0A7R9KC99_9ACAR|nr:unnamed protein product [Medioppia subpectinata]CAG2100008.1 unnamed protein product [Medioppia subpectinata]
MSRRNFGAITCESCKVFFRRANLKQKVFNCRLNNKCVINMKTRKVCKSCRLNKCVKTGMKNELIKGKQLILEDKQGLNNDNTCVDTTNDGIIENEMVDSTHTRDDSLVNEITKHDKKYINGSPTADSCQLWPSFGSVFYRITDYKSFNDLESRRLADLFSASNVFNGISFCSLNCIEITDVVELYKAWGEKMDRDMIDLVKFTKALNAFDSICLNDKLALIKYGCLEVLVLRYCILWDNETEYCTAVMPEKRNIYSVYKIYLSKILPEWNRDFIILDLLTAIVLFNPNRPNLIHPEVVKVEQQIYIYLLQRYLLMKIKSEWESRTKLSNLMNTLSDLQIISDVEVQNGGELYLQYYGPILRETLFDVTCNSMAGNVEQCVICGDQSAGRNSGVITCNSCKSLNCRFGGDCVIDIKLRKRCTSCRIKRCIEMGMKRVMAKSKVTKNNECSEKWDLTNDTIISSINETSDEIISNYGTNSEKQMNEIQIFTSKDSNGNNKSLQNSCNIDDMFVKLSFSPVFSHLDDYKTFSDLETNRLSELFISSKLALIKYGCIEILILRYSILYDINTDLWTWVWKSGTPRGYAFKLTSMKHETLDIYLFYKDYLPKVSTEFNRDYIILDLLTAIVLFDPNRPNLIHNDVVNEQHCVICGDQSKGRNFGVISCESCKVFFRRNGKQNTIPVCGFYGNCIIDVKSRKRCTNCRMKKCIQLGMKRAMKAPRILALIKYGCFEILMLRYSILYDIKTDYWTWVWKSFPQSAEEKRSLYWFYKDYLHKLHTECNRDAIIVDLLTAILLFDPSRPNLIHRNVVKAEQELYIICNIEKKNGRNFGAFSCESCKVFFRRTAHKSQIPVCRFDGNCIIDVKSRKRCTSCRMKKCIQMGMKSYMEKDVEDLISSTKNLMSFNSLCFNDQLALIKYGCLELIILRFSTFYNINTDYWTCARKSDIENVCGFKLTAIKEEKRDLYWFYKDYLPKVNTECDQDCIILDLI